MKKSILLATVIFLAASLFSGCGESRQEREARWTRERQEALVARQAEEKQKKAEEKEAAALKKAKKASQALEEVRFAFSHPQEKIPEWEKELLEKKQKSIFEETRETYGGWVTKNLVLESYGPTAANPEVYTPAVWATAGVKIEEAQKITKKQGEEAARLIIAALRKPYEQRRTEEIVVEGRWSDGYSVVSRVLIPVLKGVGWKPEDAGSSVNELKKFVIDDLKAEVENHRLDPIDPEGLYKAIEKGKKFGVDPSEIGVTKQEVDDLYR